MLLANLRLCTPGEGARQTPVPAGSGRVATPWCGGPGPQPTTQPAAARHRACARRGVTTDPAPKDTGGSSPAPSLSAKQGGAPGVCVSPSRAPLSVESFWKRAGHVRSTSLSCGSSLGGTHTCALTRCLYLCRPRGARGRACYTWEGRRGRRRDRKHRPRQPDTQARGLHFGPCRGRG